MESHLREDTPSGVLPVQHADVSARLEDLRESIPEHRHQQHRPLHILTGLPGYNPLHMPIDRTVVRPGGRLSLASVAESLSAHPSTALRVDIRRITVRITGQWRHEHE